MSYVKQKRCYFWVWCLEENTRAVVESNATSDWVIWKQIKIPKKTNNLRISMKVLDNSMFTKILYLSLSREWQLLKPLLQLVYSKIIKWLGTNATPPYGTTIYITLLNFYKPWNKGCFVVGVLMEITSDEKEIASFGQLKLTNKRLIMEHKGFWKWW